MTSTTFFFVFIPLLSIILLAINLIFATHNPYQEKDSAFECGFHSFLGQNRTQFSISFFIFALLFLLFDLEILLIYPYAVSAYANGVYGLMIMLVFFLALTLGFAFELGKNALKIDSRQQLFTITDKQINITTYISAFKLPIFFRWLLCVLMITAVLWVLIVGILIFLVKFNIIRNTIIDPIGIILSLLFTWSLVLVRIEDGLSDDIYTKYTQIFAFVCLPLYIYSELLFIYEMRNLGPIISENITLINPETGYPIIWKNITLINPETGYPIIWDNIKVINNLINSNNNLINLNNIDIIENPEILNSKPHIVSISLPSYVRRSLILGAGAGLLSYAIFDFYMMPWWKKAGIIIAVCWIIFLIVVFLGQ